MMKKNTKKLLSKDINERFKSEKENVPKLNKKEFSYVKVVSLLVALLLAFFMLFGLIAPLFQLK